MIQFHTGRRIALTVLTAMACVACNSSGGGTTAGTNPAPGSSGTSSAATTCTEPRPQMCMEIYMPACGVDKNGAQRTYPNSCHACADNAVVGFIKGKCAAN